MALENYTRGQKIFMVTLVVLLAAMFTVTGAMITLFGQGGEAAPTDHGELDGQEYRLVRWQQMRGHLGIILGLDYQAMRSFGDKTPEHIYARVPAMAPRPENDMGYGPYMRSLLELWHSYQDQNVWCHVVLAKRAQEKGVSKPSPSYMGAVLTALMNEGASELDKFPQKDLKREFEARYGTPLDEFVVTLGEAMQVRDYVESLLADEKARLSEIAMISRGNASELQAEYMLLSIEPFMEQARKEVRDEYFAWRASNAAGAFGVASPGMGYDRFLEAFDKNSGTQLQAEAQFQFDVFEAYPEDLVSAGAVAVEEGLDKIVYEAVKDQVYTVEVQKPTASIDERVETAWTNFYNANAQRLKLDEWSDEQKQKWRDEKRAEMEKYVTYEELIPELREALMQKESVRAAQMDIFRFLRYLDERKKDRERKLDAELEVVRKEKLIYDGLKAYVEDLRRQFDGVQSTAFDTLRTIETRLNSVDMGEGSDGAALENIATDMANALSNLDTGQFEALLAKARLTTNQLERTLNDKKAELEEFAGKETPKRSDGTEMTAAEIDARKRQLQLEVDAIQRKIELRDRTVPKVEAWVEKAQAAVAAYELHVRSAMAGDADLRRTVLRELLVEVPAELGAMIRAGRDEIVPQDQVDEYGSQADLVQATITARTSAKAKDAADTRDDDLQAWIAQQNPRGRKYGLKMVRGDREYTWERVVAPESSFAWLESVEGAKQFLEDPNNTAGSASSLLKRPGKGYLVLRLVAKTPKYSQGTVEAHERVLTLAAQRRARELCVKELEKVRRDILDRGWDQAFKAAKDKFGDALTATTTPWFKDNEDIPGLYSHNDSDVLKVSSSPSTTSPDAPFIQALKDIKPKEGVTSIVPSKRNDDPLRRPDRDKWGYLLARVVGRNAIEQRIGVDAFKDSTSWGSSPADIWRNRHLAASDVVRDLVEPARLLKDHNIIQYKIEKKEDEKKEEASS